MLAKVGKIIGEIVRQTDLIVRDRNGEFVVICPETDVDKLVPVAFGYFSLVELARTRKRLLDGEVERRQFPPSSSYIEPYQWPINMAIVWYRSIRVEGNGVFYIKGTIFKTNQMLKMGATAQ